MSNRLAVLVFAIGALTVGSTTACSSGADFALAPDSSADSGCTANIVMAIHLAVRDARTQAPIADSTVVTGQFSNSTFSSDGIKGYPEGDGLHIALGAAPGTYDLLIKRQGYTGLAKDSIVVSSADPHGCHPQPVWLDVFLQPNS